MSDHNQNELKEKLRKLFDPVVTRGDDAGRLESEVAEIVFNPEVSDYEYFLTCKRHFERKAMEGSYKHQPSR